MHVQTLPRPPPEGPPRALPDPPPRTRHAAVRAHLRACGAPDFHYRQLVEAVHRRGVTEFAAMTELPGRLRAELAGRFGPTFPALRPLARQADRQAEKLLFGNADGARVETVLARYRSGWTSLCLSSQVGCGLGCSFCSTGAVGLVRNLTADEICDQVLHFSRQAQVDSIAFMGMGEPLANPHLFTALTLLTDPAYFAVSPRRITVSTVGFLPGLRRLVAERPRVTVTLSVHSPFEDERAGLIPLQHRFPLRDSLEVLDAHVRASRRKTYLAYLLIDDLNDSPRHRAALADLVRARPEPALCHVSVIPYNRAAGVRAPYRAPSARRVETFIRGLRRAGVHVTRRQQFGGAVEAACGQLHAAYLS